MVDLGRAKDRALQHGSRVGIIRKKPLTRVTANAIILMQSNHESLTRDERAAPGSERSFAIVMAMALAIVASVNWWHDGHVWPWLGEIAAFFVVSGYFFPAPLKPLNRLWFKFGLLLHAVVNPIVMGLIFYGSGATDRTRNASGGQGSVAP